MKKLTLKLDALEITSFETVSDTPNARGTVAANGQEIKPAPESFMAPCYDTDANFDCTYGCSQDTACDNCIVSGVECP